jgi:hypothetical protein
MSKAEDTCRAGASSRAKGTAARRVRPGLPAAGSVLSTKTFTSPKGNRYRILKTDEKDPYDDPEDREKRRR